ncbi:transposase [Mesorhizobium sp.]|uniref:transposase n=1 Tax=Mesorhizobium sp. TaxID=1871066 RepID=UPI00345DCD13
MSDDRSFHVLEAVPNRLEGSPQRPRRRWSAEAKARLIETTLKPGANVSAICHRVPRSSRPSHRAWRRRRSRHPARASAAGAAPSATAVA